MNKTYSIEDLRSGNNKTYTFLYQEYKGDFINYARKFNLTEEEIEDTYQESLIVFYENIAEGKLTSFESTIKTYIFSIGKYKIYELLRSKKKLINTALLDGIENIVAIENLSNKETLLNEHQNKLKLAFKNLGKRCQRILELFYTENKSIKEIVQLENYENENTVKAQKSRCMKSLREMINRKS